jgi:hypothetical protein
MFLHWPQLHPLQSIAACRGLHATTKTAISTEATKKDQDGILQSQNIRNFLFLMSEMTTTNTKDGEAVRTTIACRT